MNPTNEPSMYSPRESTDWPVNAIPEKWIEVLFTAMSSTYGARFADLWRGSKTDDVKRQWAVELAKLSSPQMRAGRETLTDLERAPTLPEFMAHCRRARAEAVSTAAQITDQTPASPQVVEANLGRLHKIRAPLMQPKEPTAECAYRLLMRGTSQSGRELPYEVRRCATDAVSSSAGRKVLQSCIDPELSEAYGAIYEQVVNDYEIAGRAAWEAQ